MKKKLIALIVSTVLAAVLFCGCDLSPAVKHNTPSPSPSYTWDETSTRTPGGMIDDKGALYLKDMATGQKVAGTVDIDMKNQNNVPDGSAQADALVEAVMTDKMPVFTEDTNPLIKIIWDGGTVGFKLPAIKVLQAIIKDSMTELEKVTAIHDYLSYNVEYDTELYNKFLGQSGGVTGKESAFNAIGALYNQKAVCDGLASAFNLLARLEGIEAVRVTGAVKKILSDGSAVPQTPTVAHVWNKVRIDIDGDGSLEWYNVDTTYDRVAFVINGVSVGYLAHGYFMLSDLDIASYVPVTIQTSGGISVDCFDTRTVSGIQRFKGDTQITETAPYNADVTYDYYANAKIPVSGDNKPSAKVADADALAAVFAAVKDNKRTVGKIEVKLDFAAENNDYGASFAAAYRSASDSSFKPGVKPWTFMPNRTVFFLIYN